ncbi:BRO family protein [Acinetobacter gerneri]|uniref:BRO-N domain-containing protein n=1 Tax=Acinetobacter gerneri TaxID=202952 RepID=UPI002935F89D|nr:BRO family protein [Acinetobacter gerneri]MDV2438015.1 BRO family protein [Acinetobacter gerneri]
MSPSIFNFNNHGVRVVLDDNKEPWFCLSDICRVLDISRSSDLLQIQRGGVKNETPKRHGALDPKGVAEYHTPTSGGIQKLKFINEPNLYRIIFRSNKPQALNFQDWVFAEVLPTIRKTGSYSARQTAYEELNRICLQEKVSKDKGTFHSHGMHRRKREKHRNARRIHTCKTNIQLGFEGLHND